MRTSAITSPTGGRKTATAASIWRRPSQLSGVDDQHDVASLLLRFDVTSSLGHLRQRITSVDNGVVAAILNELTEELHVALGVLAHREQHPLAPGPGEQQEPRHVSPAVGGEVNTT